MMKMSVSMVLVLFASVALAAIPSNQTPKAAVPSAILKNAGAIHGGQAGLGFSLLALKKQTSKDQKWERLTFQIGNGALQAQRGSPGYFNIENSPQTRRVTIDFSQTLNSKFDEKALRQALAKSPLIKSSQLIFEPQGQTMSVVLEMKKPVAVRAMPMNGSGQQTAALVIDLLEESGAPKKVK